MRAVFLIVAFGGVAVYGQIPSGVGGNGQAMQLAAQAQQQAQFAMQQAQLASQAALARAQIAIGLATHQSVMLHAQTLGLSASQAAMLQTQAASMSAMLNLQVASQAARLQWRSVNLSATEIARASALRSALLTSTYRAQLLRTTATMHPLGMAQAAGQSAGQGTSGSPAPPPGTPPTGPTQPDASTQAPSPAGSETEAPPLPAPNPMMVRPTFGNPLAVAKPTFTLESGKIAAGSKVGIKTATHYSSIYYTTDGWTPTTESARYVGPIAINATTHLQAIAVGPNLLRSPVAHIEYTVPGSAPSAPQPLAVAADGILRAGTTLRLATAAEVSSERAEVGDEFPLVLDQDLKFRDQVLAAKGTKVEAVLTIADKANGSAPGDLVFEVRALTIHGKNVPLIGGETMEGSTGMLSSDQAVVKPGMPVLAIVAQDTTVTP